MTGANFDLIAATLNYELELARGNYEPRATAVLTELATTFADTFGRRYTHFNRERFLGLCLHDAETSDASLADRLRRAGAPASLAARTRAVTDDIGRGAEARS